MNLFGPRLMPLLLGSFCLLLGLHVSHQVLDEMGEKTSNTQTHEHRILHWAGELKKGEGGTVQAKREREPLRFLHTTCSFFLLLGDGHFALLFFCCLLNISERNRAFLFSSSSSFPIRSLCFSLRLIVVNG